jgi:hypothetical protein
MRKLILAAALLVCQGCSFYLTGPTPDDLYHSISRTAPAPAYVDPDEWYLRRRAVSSRWRAFDDDFYYWNFGPGAGRHNFVVPVYGWVPMYGTRWGWSPAPYYGLGRPWGYPNFGLGNVYGWSGAPNQLQHIKNPYTQGAVQRTPALSPAPRRQGLGTYAVPSRQAQPLGGTTRSFGVVQPSAPATRPQSAPQSAPAGKASAPVRKFN